MVSLTTPYILYYVCIKSDSKLGQLGTLGKKKILPWEIVAKNKVFCQLLAVFITDR